MTIEQLQKAPFYLDYQDITWVRRTLDAMTTDEKIGQLFFPIAYSPRPEDLDRLLEAHVGGILFRAGPAKEIHEAHTYLQEHTRVPLLLAAIWKAAETGWCWKARLTAAICRWLQRTIPSATRSIWVR